MIDYQIRENRDNKMKKTVTLESEAINNAQLPKGETTE